MANLNVHVIRFLWFTFCLYINGISLTDLTIRLCITPRTTSPTDIHSTIVSISFNSAQSEGKLGSRLSSPATQRRMWVVNGAPTSTCLNSYGVSEVYLVFYSPVRTLPSVRPQFQLLVILFLLLLISDSIKKNFIYYFVEREETVILGEKGSAVSWRCFWAWKGCEFLVRERREDVSRGFHVASMQVASFKLVLNYNPCDYVVNL